MASALDAFDYRHPVYAPIFAERVARLARIRQDPSKLPYLRTYYRSHPVEFICDWGCTIDPRLIERGLPAVIPFILFPKQKEWIEWVIGHWRSQTPGISEKSRDWGLTWLAVSLSCTLCIFYEGMAIGFGSRKEEYVDRIGDPKSILQKGRVFMSLIPVEFRSGWEARRDAPHMRLNFPYSGSNIAGEAGDNIGRGDRKSIYFVDEAAYLERPERTEASLSQTTNCRVDISSAHGMNNPFAVKRHSGRIDVFTGHWRDDPRKDEAWYQKQCNELDPVTVAQEIDINYQASLEGILIPSEWVHSAIDAHKHLQFAPSGARGASLDVADEGRDLNALCGTHGSLVETLEEWSGEGADILATVTKAFTICDMGGYQSLEYDADGLGAGVRGDARILNEKRKESGQAHIAVTAFRGSESVINPDEEDIKGRTNADMFLNRKAQAWWSLRTRFQRTHRAVRDGIVAAHDDLISIPSDLPLLLKLRRELSQPTYYINPVGKIMVNKAPDGVRSPNLADAVMIRFSGTTTHRALFSTGQLEHSRRLGMSGHR